MKVSLDCFMVEISPTFLNLTLSLSLFQTMRNFYIIFFHLKYLTSKRSIFPNLIKNKVDYTQLCRSLKEKSNHYMKSKGKFHKRSFKQR